MRGNGIPPKLLDALYDSQFDPLVRHASGLLGGDRVVAEDLVQEAFMRLMRVPPRDPERSRSWLRTVVSRLCLDQLRRQRREALRREETAAETVPPALSAEEQVLQGAERERLVRALGRLDRREQRALWLRHSGYSYREIAAVLSLEEARMGVFLLRAMHKLRQHYNREEEEQRDRSVSR